VGAIEVGLVVQDTILLHSQAQLVVPDLGIPVAVPALRFMVIPASGIRAMVMDRESASTSLDSRSTLATAGGN
jgi:hypothetical protein